MAARGVALDRVLDLLEWEPTGREEEHLDTGLWAVHRGDWLIICAAGWEYMELLTEDHAKALSKTAPTLYWWGDDTPMRSGLEEFADGTSRWLVDYRGTHGVSTPTVRGEPPDALEEARAGQQARQDAEGEDADVDHLYEIPHVLGELLTDFRHDDGDLPDGERRFILLRPRADPPDAEKSFRPIEERLQHGPLTLRLFGSESYGLQLELTASAAVQGVVLRQIDRDGDQVRNIREFAADLTLEAGASRDWWTAPRGGMTEYRLTLAGEAKALVLGARRPRPWWRFWN